MTSPNGPKPAEILLVEDDEGDVLLTEEAFKSCRLPPHFSTVQDGDEAMAFLRREGRFSDAPRPALILLDLNLPRKDGRELLAELKRTPPFQAIPVIVLTTSDSAQDILKAYELHANAYLTKPLNLDRFMEVAQRVEEFWLETARLPASGLDS